MKTTHILAVAFLLLLTSPIKAQPEDLTLSASIEKALEYNYGIRISKSSVEVAGINNNWATAGRVPRIGYRASSSGDFNYYNTNETSRENLGWGTTGSVDLNWTIFNGFRAISTKERLEELEELARGQLGVVVENTLEEVIMAYYNVLLQKKNLEVMETVMNLSKDRYDYETARHSLGGSATYNVLQAKNVYLNDKALFMDQEVAVRNSIHDLNFLIGVDPTVNWNFPEPFEPDTTAYVLADLSAKMIVNNQTLRNQYTNLQIKNKDINLSRSAYWPSLDLSAGLNDRSDFTLYIENGDTYRNTALWTYGGLSLNWNIYLGGSRKRSLEIARINKEVAMVKIEEMEHALINELLNMYDFYNVRIALFEVANESLEAAELNMTIADEKFRNGAISSFEYRDIQLIYLNSALQRLKAIYNLIGSRTALTRLTGGFLTENNPDESE